MPTLGLILAAVAALASFLTAWWIMRRARRLGLVQEPNARSSHTTPTPAGGGVGIAVGGTIAGLVSAVLLPYLAVPVIMASLLIAYVGYTDDRQPLPTLWRLIVQIVLMGAVVAVLPLDVLSLLTGLPELAIIVVLAVAGALWINLFNFMDGIDGLAASEAVFVLVGAALLTLAATPAQLGDPILWWMIGLAAASLGFLLLNWPPARLFMGDAGSTYLGLMIAFFALITITSFWLSLWQWLILAALFLADSLTTLGRRIILRERFWEAHKRHAYQVLQRRFGSHRKVTLLYIAIDVLVLLPLAWVAGHYAEWAPAITVAVLAVLALAALWAGAGAPLEQGEEVGAGAENGH